MGLVGFGTALAEIAPGVPANVVITLFPPGSLAFLTQPTNAVVGGTRRLMSERRTGWRS